MAIMCPSPNNKAVNNIIEKYGKGVGLYMYAVERENLDSMTPVKISNYIENLNHHFDSDFFDDFQSIYTKIEGLNKKKEILKTFHDKSETENQQRVINELMNSIDKDISNFNEIFKEAQEIKKFDVGTVSVTKFIGKMHYSKHASQETWYRDFGDLIHNYLEDIFLEDVKLIHNKEYFKTFLEDFKKQRDFDIDNINTDEIYGMVNEMAISIASHYQEGSVIIPEIPIFGEISDKYGKRKIRGIIDMAIVNPQGEVTIIDFKNKKINNLLTKRGDGETKIENTDIIPQLATYSKQIENDGITPFEGNNITIMGQWMLQLKTYMNILNQMGVTVKDSSILANLYSLNEDFSFQNSLQVKLNFNDMYFMAHSYSIRDGKLKAQIDNHHKSTKRMLNEVDKLIFVKQSNEQQEINKSLFNPTDGDIIKLVKNLKNTIDSNITTTQELLNKTKDIAKKSFLSERLKELRKVQEFINKHEKGDINSLHNSIVFNNAISDIHSDLKNLNIEIQNTVKKHQSVLKKIKELGTDYASLTQSDILQMNEALGELSYMWESSKIYSSTIKSLEEIIEGFENQDDVGIQNLKKTLDDIRTNSMQIQIDYRTNAVKGFVISFVKGLGPKFAKRAASEVAQSKKLRLKNKQKELENLKEKGSDNPGLIQTLKRGFIFLINKEAREEFKNQFNDKDQAFINRVERLEQEIIELQNEIEGMDYENISNLFSLIENTTDYHNPVHSMNDLHGGYSSLLASYPQAASTSPNFLIAMATTYFKNLQNVAQHNVVNDVVLQKISKISQEALRKSENDIINLNKKLFEWVEVPYYDKTTKSIQTKESYNLKSIFSKDYAKNVHQLKANTRLAKHKWQEVKKEFYDNFNKSSDTTKDRVLVRKAFQEYMDAKGEEKKFLLENSNNEYIDAFYELDTKIPIEYAQRIEELKLQKEDIMYNSEEAGILNDRDLDVLMKLESEILEIRETIKKENPDYAEALDKYNELYEYQLNDSKFERRRRNIELQHGINSDNYNKWLEQNQITRAKAEFWNEYMNIQSEKEELFGRNEVLGNLYKERSSLLKPYKDASGQIIPRFIPSEVIHKLDIINEQIGETISYLKKDSKGLLTPEEWIIYNDIETRLNAISKKGLSEFYKQEKSEQYDVLKMAYDNYLKAYNKHGNLETQESGEDLNVAYEHFLKTEESFKVWFTKNHLGNYKSITQNSDIFREVIVRDFNYSIMPNDESLLETVPHPRNYSIRRLKVDNWKLDGRQLSQGEIYELQTKQDWKQLVENGSLEIGQGLKNPNYLGVIDGIPLPKGIIKNKDGLLEIMSGYENSNNINQEVVKINNDKQLNEIYNSVALLASQSHQRAGTEMSYRVPAQKTKVLDNIQSYGIIKTAQRATKLAIDEAISIDSEVDRMHQEFKSDGHIHHMYNPANQLSRNKQSEDGLQSFLNWGAETHVSQTMSTGQFISKGMTDYIDMMTEEIRATHKGGDKTSKEMQKRANMLEKTKNAILYEHRKLFYNQYDNNQFVGLKKGINLMMQYVSLIRIGFDIANQTKNFTASSVQQFIAAGHSGDHYTRNNWTNAYKIFSTKFMPSYFKDYGKLYDLDVHTMIYRTFNPMQKEVSYFTEDTITGAGRKRANIAIDIYGLGYLAQDRGDTTIATITMYSVLDHYQYKTFDMVNGEKVYRTNENGDIIKVKGHEVFTINKDGQLIIRPDVEFTIEDQNYLRRVIISEMRKAQGNYAKADQTRAEEDIVLRMAFFFRKYLVPLMRNRFGGLRPSWETGEAAYGYWLALAHAFKYYGVQATLKEYLIGSKMLNKIGKTGLPALSLKTTDDTYKTPNLYVRKIAQARRDTVAMLMLWSASILALGFLKQRQEDDEEINMIEGNIIRILWGTRGEALGVFPVGPGGDEYIRNFTTAIPFQREFLKTKKGVGDLYYWVLAHLMHSGVEFDERYHSDYYERVYKRAYYQGKSAPYGRGDAKVRKLFVDMTGIKNIRDLFQPENRLEQMKRFIQL